MSEPSPDTPPAAESLLKSASPSPPKVADRPHTTSIILSLLAILVSGVSFWQSWESAKLVKASTRADVEITQMHFRVAPNPFIHDPPQLSKGTRPRVMTFLIEHPAVVEGVIANFGKTRAAHVKIPLVEVKYGGERANGYYTDKDVITIPDLAPGRTQPIYFPVHFNFAPMPHNIKLFGTLEYVDEATNITYHDKWCYQTTFQPSPLEFVFCSEQLPTPPPMTVGKP